METPTIYDYLDALERSRAGDEHALDRFRTTPEVLRPVGNTPTPLQPEHFAQLAQRMRGDAPKLL